MKVRKKVLFILIFIIVIISVVNMVFPKNDIYRNHYLGSGFYYHSEQKHIVVDRSSKFNASAAFDIPPVVEKFDFDNKYIVAIQKPRQYDEALYHLPNADMYLQGRDTLYYWIIVKKTHTVFGPMTAEEYSCFSDSLRIRLSL